jgi:hypothetical protein
VLYSDIVSLRKVQKFGRFYISTALDSNIGKAARNFKALTTECSSLVACSTFTDLNYNFACGLALPQHLQTFGALLERQCMANVRLQATLGMPRH